MEKLHIPNRWMSEYQLACFTQGMDGSTDKLLLLMEELGDAEFKLYEPRAKER